MVFGAAEPVRFDVCPFTLPSNPPGTVRFEETHDVVAVELTLDGQPSADIGPSYFQDNWPSVKLEQSRDLTSFDAAEQDVDLTGSSGTLAVEVRF